VNLFAKAVTSMRDRLKPEPPEIHDPRQHEMRDIVVIYLPDRVEADAIDLEAALGAACASRDVGISGSTEQEGTEVALYFYGPEAEPLFAALKPTLLAHSDAKDAQIVLATGLGGSRQYSRFPLHAPLEVSARSTP
jgi:hypothetical protein